MSNLIENESPCGTSAARVETVTPAVNIHQDADGYTLEAEMPGVSRDGVAVTFDDGKLVIEGHRARALAEDTRVYRESSDADYRRAFDLDPTIDASRIEAEITQGVLTVRLPKAEAAKPRRITVG